MRYIFVFFLTLAKINTVSAACSSYSGVTFEASSALTNVIINRYDISASASHSIILYADSLDYAGGSLTCKQLIYSKSLPDSEDDLARDELLRSIKLSMTLGYKLSFTNIISINGSVRISNANFNIMKP